MSELVHDCPRCGAKLITFDVINAANAKNLNSLLVQAEVFCNCRRCKQAVIFVCRSKFPIAISNFYSLIDADGSSAINGALDVDGFVSIREMTGGISVPEHVPQDIAKIFEEGAICASVGCFNAAGTMFRLCVDKATEKLLPDDSEHGLNAKIRRSLGLRLEWLFENRRLDPGIQELSHCIKEDGNDGAHQGTLYKVDVEDIQDFTVILLDKMFTQPERLRLASIRRNERRPVK